MHRQSGWQSNRRRLERCIEDILYKASEKIAVVSLGGGPDGAAQSTALWNPVKAPLRCSVTSAL